MLRVLKNFEHLPLYIIYNKEENYSNIFAYLPKQRLDVYFTISLEVC